MGEFGEELVDVDGAGGVWDTRRNTVCVWKPGVSSHCFLRLYYRIDWKMVLVFFDANGSSREGGIGLVRVIGACRR